jgi:hypothetical protein
MFRERCSHSVSFVSGDGKGSFFNSKLKRHYLYSLSRYFFVRIYFCLKCNLLASHPSSSPHVSVAYGRHQVLSYLAKIGCAVCQNYVYSVHTVNYVVESFIMAVFHSFKIYLLEFFSFWIYSRCGVGVICNV